MRQWAGDHRGQLTRLLWVPLLMVGWPWVLVAPSRTCRVVLPRYRSPSCTGLRNRRHLRELMLGRPSLSWLLFLAPRSSRRRNMHYLWPWSCWCSAHVRRSLQRWCWSTSVTIAGSRRIGSPSIAQGWMTSSSTSLGLRIWSLSSTLHRLGAHPSPCAGGIGAVCPWHQPAPFVSRFWWA